MTKTRFDLTIPRGFVYADHPFIDHETSDFVITTDPQGADTGTSWKVCRPKSRVNPTLVDLCYFSTIGQAFDFVEMVTFTTNKSFGYETTRNRSSWYTER